MKRSTRWSRRALLGVVGTATAIGISGCLGRSEPRTYGLLVVNYRNGSRKIGVTVTRKDTSETLLDETYVLGSNDRVSEESVFENPATYTITAKTRAGTTASTDFTVGESDQPPVDAFHVHLTAGGELNLFLPAP